MSWYDDGHVYSSRAYPENNVYSKLSEISHNMDRNINRLEYFSINIEKATTIIDGPRSWKWNIIKACGIVIMIEALIIGTTTIIRYVI